MNTVSIITPMYNSKAFISKTIDSVICQYFTDWEYIIIDDCSSDGSAEYVKNKYHYESRITVIESRSNLGVGVSRNIGLAAANGSLIAFLDSDDIWLPQKLSKQVQFMLHNKFAITHTSFSFINEGGEKRLGRVNVSKSVNLKRLMRSTEIGMSTSLINKDIVGDFIFSSMRGGGDTKLWVTLLGKGFISHGLDDDLVLYRVRKGQISGNKIKSALRVFLVYLSVSEIPFYERLVNFCYYGLNGITKRLRR